MKRLATLFPAITAARRTAAARLSQRGMRGHLIAATVVFTTLWVGLLYGMECLFATVPWATLNTAAPALFEALDLALYLMDGLLVIFLILPLAYGYARILSLAARGELAPLTVLFSAFESSRMYRRALGRSLIVALPRAVALSLLGLLFSAAQAADTTPVVLLLALAMAAVLLLSTFLSGLDTALGALWQRGLPRAVRRSRELCRGRLLEIWLLRLSFVGWGMLSLASLGVVAVIAALPLYALSLFAYSHSLLPLDNCSEENDIA